jgi:putative endonuclease
MSAMALSHDLGSRSEALAATHLEQHGWTLLARNYRSGHREIDIIARRASVIAFVEVKARAGTSYGHPLEAITALKRREIEIVARWWIHCYGRARHVYRFDAIAIFWPHDGPPVLEHFEDAWRL